MPTDEGAEEASRGGEPASGGPPPASAADVEALRADVAALEETLADLREELRRGDGRSGQGLADGRQQRVFRPPRFGDLRRFTTEVSIPVAVLVLETNLRALRILQRALRAGGGSGTSDNLGPGSRVGRHAADAGQRALARLDDALADLRSSAATSGGAEGGAVEDLLAEADRLRERVRTELERVEAETTARERSAVREGVEGTAGSGTTAEVPVDVESELDSIRAEVDGEGEDG